MQMQAEWNNYAHRQDECDDMSSDLAQHQHIGQGHDLDWLSSKVFGFILKKLATGFFFEAERSGE